MVDIHFAYEFPHMDKCVYLVNEYNFSRTKLQKDFNLYLSQTNLIVTLCCLGLVVSFDNIF